MSQQINLFNPVFLRQKKVFSATTMVQALGMVFLGVLAIYAYAIYQARALESVAADSEEQLKARRGQLVRLGTEFSPQGRSKLLEEELARLEARLKSREALLIGIRTGVSGDVNGFSPYMTAFARQNTQGVWLTGFTLGGASNDLTVKGRVLNPELVPAYLLALNRESVMSGRQISELKLTARDEATPPQGGAAPSAAAQAAPAPAAGPARFVEFSFTVPLGAPAAAPAGRSRS